MKNTDIYEVEDCGCFGPKLNLNEAQAETIELSEGLQYHITEGRMLIHNIYRPLSNSYFALVREARELYNNGLLNVTEDDMELLESDLGEIGEYNGIRVPLDYVFSLDELLNEVAKKEKKHPPLGKPHRGGSKKFYVFVKDPKTKRIKKVSFGDTTGLRAKLNNPKARQAFSKRHNCPQKKDRTKASYWSRSERAHV